MKKPKAIFLDLDDTILAFSAGAELCWEKVCHHATKNLERLTAADLRQAIDKSRKAYWANPEMHRKGRLNLLDARREIVANALNEADIGEAVDAIAIADMYSAMRVDSVALFPGAIDAIRHFRSCGILLALITNGSSKDQRYKIDKHGLAPLFENILIEEEFGIGKPDESVYLHALEELSVPADETWIVGDNLIWEVAVPQTLGLFTVWHDYANQGLPKDSTVCPDYIVNRLSDLIPLIE